MIRSALRWLLAIFYAFAGYAHTARPDPFLLIMPPWVPEPEAIVLWTGIAELLGAAALLQPFSTSLRKAGAIGLAAYAVCVFPANIHHFALDMARPDGGFGLGYHVPRMFAQPILVWLALWTGGVTDWPLRRR
ncbi:DoxX family protein [Qipengyuania sp. 6B39]|uniref:DoxX family protein n=1 Tax=Qipengyuania proteolytica TaxID=2867239 RepID=UPI001C8A09DE|nr:DoxX family protein [Qipengyuania proteolytica]MBX7495046.1 DoxX family protein [Qipengyuania proteolytica]